MSRSAAIAIARELAALYGPDVDWRRASGVVHVAAIGAHPRAALVVGPTAPRSATDRFILGFARARADAIVTTSAILRAEPGLVHRTSEASDEEAAWRRWRLEVLGRRMDPDLIVLSHRGVLPSGHPALLRAGGVVVVTSALGRARLAGAAQPFEVVVADDPDGDPAPPSTATGAPVGRESVEPDDAARRSLSWAIAWVRERRGAETLVIEAGPRSTAGLYRSGLESSALAEAGSVDAPSPSVAERALARVDELLLSIFMGDRFEAVPGPELPSPAVLARYFECARADAPGEAGSAEPRSRCRREEASGPWTFERYRCRAARG